MGVVVYPCGDSPTIFTGNAVTRENHWRITPPITIENIVHCNTYAILYIHNIWHIQYLINAYLKDVPTECNVKYQELLFDGARTFLV